MVNEIPSSDSNEQPEKAKNLLLLRLEHQMPYLRELVRLIEEKSNIAMSPSEIEVQFQEFYRDMEQRLASGQVRTDLELYRNLSLERLRFNDSIKNFVSEDPDIDITDLFEEDTKFDQLSDFEANPNILFFTKIEKMLAVLIEKNKLVSSLYRNRDSLPAKVYELVPTWNGIDISSFETHFSAFGVTFIVPEDIFQRIKPGSEGTHYRNTPFSFVKQRPDPDSMAKTQKHEELHNLMEGIFQSSGYSIEHFKYKLQHLIVYYKNFGNRVTFRQHYKELLQYLNRLHEEMVGNLPSFLSDITASVPAVLLEFSTARNYFDQLCGVFDDVIADNGQNEDVKRFLEGLRRTFISRFRRTENNVRALFDLIGILQKLSAGDQHIQDISIDIYILFFYLRPLEYHYIFPYLQQVYPHIFVRSIPVPDVD